MTDGLVLFLLAPAGHEIYLAELGQLVARGGPVDPAGDRGGPRPLGYRAAHPA